MTGVITKLHTCRCFGECRTFRRCRGRWDHMQGRGRVLDRSSTTDDRARMHRWTSDPTCRMSDNDSFK